MKSPRHFALVPLLLISAALASRWLGRDMLFVDEWWSIFKAGGDIYGPLSPVGVWNRIVEIDPGGMGAGYYVTLNLWIGLVGATPFAVRAYSLVFGLLTIAMTFRIGASWFSPRVGLLAAILMGTSAFLINYMHEARAYTLVAFMTCCVVWTYWRAVSIPSPRLRHYAALTLALAGLAYSHYVALVVPAAIVIYHALRFANTRRWWQIAASAVVAALLYVPWLPVILDVVQRGAGDINRHADSMNASQAVATLADAFSNGSPALLIALLAVAVWAWRQRMNGTPIRTVGPHPLPLLIVWLVTGLAGALAVNAALPFLVHLRYLIFLWPALALAVALGIHAISRRGVPAYLLIGAWAALGIVHGLSPDFMRGLFGEIYRPPAAGIERAMRIIEAEYQPDDLILFRITQPGFGNFGLFIEDYLTRNLTGQFPNTTARAQTEFMNNSLGERSDAAYRQDVLTVLADHPRVWIAEVPEIPVTQRSATLADTLAERYANCGTLLDVDGGTLRLYALPAPSAQHVFGDGDLAAAMDVVVPAGVTEDGLRLALMWQAADGLRGGTHSVAVHLTDASGVTVAQDDYPLPTGDYGCHVTRFAPPPAGEYAVFVTVYDWRTSEVLPLAASADGRLQIGRFG